MFHVEREGSAREAVEEALLAGGRVAALPTTEAVEAAFKSMTVFERLWLAERLRARGVEVSDGTALGWQGLGELLLVLGQTQAAAPAVAEPDEEDDT